MQTGALWWVRLRAEGRRVKALNEKAQQREVTQYLEGVCVGADWGSLVG